MHKPVDFGSCGFGATEVLSDSLLLNILGFFCLPDPQWPDLELENKCLPEIQTEEKPSSTTITAASAHEYRERHYHIGEKQKWG